MSINNKNIIVTGGCGFIGSFLTERLCKENSVCAIDNLSRGKLSN
ncbi:MAG TPA: GDP-mannose 4,6-dehydratase, partial [Flavobacteriaceae bacterium]|nr:GDP-mannose 4,6-dehydratase [Flavobacteriaceae bacterium]